MDNNQTLLPTEAITAELLEAVCLEIIEEDKGRTPDDPPAFFYRLKAEAAKAIDFETTGFSSVLESAREREQEPGKYTGGTVIKLMYMGWRMADIYLRRELEKGGEA